MTRNTTLLLLGVLTFGVVPWLYARHRTRPTPWREEQRRANKLSAVVENEGAGWVG